LNVLRALPGAMMGWASSCFVCALRAWGPDVHLLRKRKTEGSAHFVYGKPVTDLMRALSSANYILHFFLYHTVGRYLPSSTAPGGTLWRTLRYWLCRPLFEHCGQNVNVGRDVSIGRRTVSIGSNSGIGNKSVIHGGTNIGTNVMMGPEVLIYTTNHCTARTDMPMIHQGVRPVAAVNIGDDVWIGARVIILPGVTVGSGSVLGAGAVISKDIPPFAVVVGNPCRVVRLRNQSPQATQHTENSKVSRGAV
jgi:maltose O-acetyltransferase